MKTVAYLRVSTSRQNVQGQRLAILEYARRHSLRIDEFIEATASARTSPMRRRLDDLMDALEPGDRLVVSELSRLGRSLGQIVAMLDTLAREGIAFIAFIAIKEQIRIEGKQDIQTKVMTTLFALFAEVERDLISERTREGLAKARSSGKKLGRPKGSLGVSRLDGQEGEIRHFRLYDTWQAAGEAAIGANASGHGPAAANGQRGRLSFSASASEFPHHKLL